MKILLRVFFFVAVANSYETGSLLRIKQTWMKNTISWLIKKVDTTYQYVTEMSQGIHEEISRIEMLEVDNVNTAMRSQISASLLECHRLMREAKKRGIDVSSCKKLIFDLNDQRYRVFTNMTGLCSKYYDLVSVKSNNLKIMSETDLQLQIIIDELDQCGTTDLNDTMTSESGGYLCIEQVNIKVGRMIDTATNRLIASLAPLQQHLVNAVRHPKDCLKIVDLSNFNSNVETLQSRVQNCIVGRDVNTTII